MSLALLRQQLAEVLDGTKPGTPGLPTGIAALDAALPNSGLPRGRLTELVGAPGGGKTTVVRQMVERAVTAGWWVAYIDAARTLAPRDWAQVGAHTTADGEPGLWVVRPHDPARGSWCADVLLRSGAFALVVLDGAPLLNRNVAVRLTRLAREADAALLVLSDESKASELAGSLRLRVEKATQPKPPVRRRPDIGAPRTESFEKEKEKSAAERAARNIVVVIEKGAPYQTVNVGEEHRGTEVARRVRTHPEVPDRRGVARTQQNPRSRRCAEPELPKEPFLANAVAGNAGTSAAHTLGRTPNGTGNASSCAS